MFVEWQAARTIARVWWPALVGALVISGPAFLLGQCSGAQAQKDRETAASIWDVRRVGEANTTAAGQRVTDANRITAAQQEQSNAIQSAPDQKPGPGRLRRACEQLRQQGTERLPPECGPES